MVIWVVYLDYDHEGCTAPKGVFSTKEKADEYVRLSRLNRYQTWVVEPYEVDNPDA